MVVLKVQRACNGCGARLRDATVAECEAAIDGALTDVTAECPTCNPVLGAALDRAVDAEMNVEGEQRLYVQSVKAFSGMGMAVMEKIAGGGTLAEVLDVVGDWMNGRDCVDDESIALFERAKTVAG